MRVTCDKDNHEWEGWSCRKCGSVNTYKVEEEIEKKLNEDIMRNCPYVISTQNVHDAFRFLELYGDFDVEVDAEEVDMGPPDGTGGVEYTMNALYELSPRNRETNFTAADKEARANFQEVVGVLQGRLATKLYANYSDSFFKSLRLVL